MWETESEGRGIGSYKYEDRQDSSSVKNDGFERRGLSWHVTSDIPSDLLVKVGDSMFHLHKFPLLARSGKMNRIIYETTSSIEIGQTMVELDDLPGGPESFELAAKFCYGISVDLTATNISGLRCTAEYLEMTEDLEEGNLIFKTEAFLSYVVLSSWRDSIVVLKSCENLSPWAENLQIVRRCSESIAWKACANPRSIRWAYTGRVNSPKWNNAGSKESSPSRNNVVPPDWWFEDISLLRIDHFVRVVTAIKVKGMHYELIAAAIVQYATKWLPGLGKDSSSHTENDDWNQGGLHIIVSSTINKDDMTSSQVKNQRMIIESLISIIPPQKDCVSCSFLLRLLKLANMLKVAPALVTELEKRVGMQLEQASLADLLIPSYNKSETVHDVDLVQRLVEHFLVQENTESGSPGRETYEKHGYDSNVRSGGNSAKMRVARLLDSYLTEVSRDRNLSLTKFQVLAEAFPESARGCDDGLYRAIDSYLKAHPTLTEHERKRLCRVMDCQKLSIDACMHAAQNERLPLRVVVQVLFSEQVKISNAISNSSLKDTENPYNNYQPMVSTRKQLLEGTPQSFQEGWATAKKDINTLKFELENMKAKYLELQHDMDNLQRQFETMTPTVNKSGSTNKGSGTSAWSSGWKKLGKLAKAGGGENNEMGGRVMAAPGPESGSGPGSKKAPRRWRYSIS